MFKSLHRKTEKDFQQYLCASNSYCIDMISLCVETKYGQTVPFSCHHLKQN